jgi:hypothetical protein
MQIKFLKGRETVSIPRDEVATVRGWRAARALAATADCRLRMFCSDSPTRLVWI